MNWGNIRGGPLKGSTDASKVGTSRTVARGLDGDGAIYKTIIIGSTQRVGGSSDASAIRVEPIPPVVGQVSGKVAHKEGS